MMSFKAAGVFGLLSMVGVEGAASVGAVFVALTTVVEATEVFFVSTSFCEERQKTKTATATTTTIRRGNAFFIRVVNGHDVTQTSFSNEAFTIQICPVAA